jgi:bifunctional DNA-binding transcriptional regulator/antitoxin component of YhaV-PrlF toxin-antitoxin module
MIVEVNDSGEILIPAELVRAAPRTRLEADREGDLVVLKPLAARPVVNSHSIVDSLPIVEGRPADPGMTFRREDIYGPDAAR